MERLVTQLSRVVPHGSSLPAEEWAVRHRALVGVAWAVALLLVPYTFQRGYDVGHALIHAAPIVGLALLAGSTRLGTRARSVACSLALLTAAAVFVHASDGLIESHFAFFVLIVALTLYEDWVAFVIAIAFVLVHHGVFGMLYPHEVYAGESLTGSPWVWASIHAAFVAAAGFAAVVTWRFNEKVRDELRALAAERAALVDRLDSLARQDPLTGVANRRAWHEKLVDELRRAARSGGSLSVAVLDLDDFKQVNDSQGHQAGDRLLRSTAGAWQGSIRATDYLARIGGDEFGVVFPDCSADEALEIVQRMCESMPTDGTCSAGVAQWQSGEPATHLLKRADEALYDAKKAGRNRALASVSGPQPA